MTRQEVAAKLREALAVMNDKGAHWVKGEYSEVLEWDDFDAPLEIGYCSLGAIRHVTGTSVEGTSYESNEVALTLAQVLPDVPEPAVPGLRLATAADRAFDKIVTWNDNDERTWEEVVAKFNEAAALAEQGALPET